VGWARGYVLKVVVAGLGRAKSATRRVYGWVGCACFVPFLYDGEMTLMLNAVMEKQLVNNE
jgi:hypothetical protein